MAPVHSASSLNPAQTSRTLLDCSLPSAGFMMASWSSVATHPAVPRTNKLWKLLHIKVSEQERLQIFLESRPSLQSTEQSHRFNLCIERHLEVTTSHCPITAV